MPKKQLAESPPSLLERDVWWVLGRFQQKPRILFLHFPCLANSYRPTIPRHVQSQFLDVLLDVYTLR